jgi:hypothetical protein
MPAPRTDLSDDGLRAAIEADQIANRVLAPEVPVEIHDDRDATWGIAGYPDPFRNTVVAAHFTAADADRRIREISAAFAARGTGFLWWLAPFHEPADLGRRLLDAGLRFEGTAPAMAIDLEALPRGEPLPPGLDVVAVRETATLREFVGVLAAEMGVPEGSPNPAAAHHAALLEAIPPATGSAFSRRPTPASPSIAGSASGRSSITRSTRPEGRACARAW